MSKINENDLSYKQGIEKLQKGTEKEIGDNFELFWNARYDLYKKEENWPAFSQISRFQYQSAKKIEEFLLRRAEVSHAASFLHWNTRIDINEKSDLAHLFDFYMCASGVLSEVLYNISKYIKAAGVFHNSYQDLPETIREYLEFWISLFNDNDDKILVTNLRYQWLAYLYFDNSIGYAFNMAWRKQYLIENFRKDVKSTLFQYADERVPFLKAINQNVLAKMERVLFQLIDTYNHLLDYCGSWLEQYRVDMKIQDSLKTYIHDTQIHLERAKKRREREEQQNS